jgi:hypothetical protein
MHHPLCEDLAFQCGLSIDFWDTGPVKIIIYVGTTRQIIEVIYVSPIFVERMHSSVHVV